MLDTTEIATMESDSDLHNPPQIPLKALKVRQIKAANMVGKSMKAPEICKALKISRYTLASWMKLETFQELVMEAARQDIWEMRATKNRAIYKAWNILEGQLDDEESKARVEIAREIGRATL